MPLMLTLVTVMLLAAQPHSQNSGSSPVPSGAANIKLANFSMPDIIGTDAPLNFFVSLQNSGGLASGNITININIKGPSGEFNQTYSAQPLSPLQNESLTISVHNSSQTAGNYAATVNAGYMLNGLMYYTKPLTSNYTVLDIQNPYGANTTSITQTPQLSIPYIPIYTALFLGKESLSEIGVKNPSTLPEFVNISVDKFYSNLIVLSTNSIYLQPNETLYVQFVLRAHNNSAVVATYSIPINLSITQIGGKHSTVTERIALTIKNTSSEQPGLLNEITLINSTNSTTGTIEISSGTNRSIKNATLATYLPSSVADNASGIKTYGLQANVTQIDGQYRIYWFVPYLPAGEVIDADYQIPSLENQQFTSQIRDILTIPSVLRPTSIIRVVNFSLPNFYTNSTERISADVLYTGTSMQEVYFYLTGPPGVMVYNSSQVVNATPNELLSRDFVIKTGGNSGTLIFTLYVDTEGANTTYSLPIIVLQNPSTVKTHATTSVKSSSAGTAISTKELTGYAEIIIAIILIVLIIYGVMVIANRPRYSKKRIKQLINVKDQIRRQGGNIG